MIITLILVAILMICATLYSIQIRKRQQKNEFDKGMNAATLKHPFLANLMILTYLLIPIAAVLLILYYYNF